MARAADRGDRVGALTSRGGGGLTGRAHPDGPHAILPAPEFDRGKTTLGFVFGEGPPLAQDSRRRRELGLREQRSQPEGTVALSYAFR